jgi:hypothetical protein
MDYDADTIFIILWIVIVVIWILWMVAGYFTAFGDKSVDIDDIENEDYVEGYRNRYRGTSSGVSSPNFFERKKTWWQVVSFILFFLWFGTLLVVGGSSIH